METLRAIPWIFAWTQIRMVLPAWLGIDTALRRLFDDVSLLRLPAPYLQSAAPGCMQPQCLVPCGA